MNNELSKLPENQRKELLRKLNENNDFLTAIVGIAIDDSEKYVSVCCFDGHKWIGCTVWTRRYIYTVISNGLCNEFLSLPLQPQEKPINIWS